ncbi:hypothetical protein [Methylobacterium sp. Leaf100]|uniref:hypothetical protein n=1 Tax=Methylobacterium sp. Leaf100 TaxID=1736252 RepID=UPI000AC60D9D|nr:hypothetical protein [Methylobacterium sp. Leaf100]
MSGLVRFGFILAGLGLRGLARIPVFCGERMLAGARACEARGRPTTPDPPPAA